MFLSMIIVQFVVVFGLAFFARNLSINMAANLIISELILLVPALVFVFATKTRLKEAFAFRKIKISTALMTVVFVFLSMPLVTTINAVSMLFTDNVVAEMSVDVLNMPFLVMLFLMGIYGPVCEELVFRGVAHAGYRRTCNAFQAIIFSGILFALIHMNFNQAMYAFVIGIGLALLKEATGSILAPIIYHVVFNSHSVVLMFLSEKLVSDSGIAETVMNQKTLITTISSTLLIAVVTTAIAGCVLVWMAGNEGRKSYLLEIWTRRKEGCGKPLTAPFVIGVIICLAYMTLLLIL